MKKTLFAALVSVAVLGTPEKAYSEYEGDVQELLSWCEIENKRRFEAGYCKGMLGGVLFTMIVSKSASRLLDDFCPPMETTAGAVEQAFKNWVRENPKIWTSDSKAGVFMAMKKYMVLQIGTASQAWECG